MNMKALMLYVVSCSSMVAWAAPLSVEQLARGKKVADAMCVSCHGVDGNSVIAANPSLAGQGTPYLFNQLRAFKNASRVNPVMMGIAASLSDQEMRDVSVFYGEQKPEVSDATDEELVEKGRVIYRVGNRASGVPACMACHGPDGRGIPSQFPRLSGQHPSYVYAQLQAFKEGIQRKNDSMKSIAHRLTDEEMKAVSEYIGGLR